MSTSPSAQSPPRNRPRKKRSADVVLFEDLLAAHKTEREPGQLPREGVVLIGVDLELQRRMAERQFPSPTTAPPTAPTSSAPKFSALGISPQGSQATTEGALNDSALNNSAPEAGAPNFSAPVFSAGDYYTDRPLTDDEPGSLAEMHDSEADCSAPEFSVRDLLVRRSGSKTYTVHSVSRIQDVFTAAERDLLRWLWERGRPVPRAPNVRLVTGPNGEGARRLAAQAGLIYNTFKNLSRTLSTKFALDIVKPERNLPAIYVVYHYSAILERQRQSGFTGAVHKNGGGRELVNSQAQPAPRRPDLTLNQLEASLNAPNFSAPLNGLGAPKSAAGFDNSSAPNSAAPIRNKKYTSDKGYTSTSTPDPNAGAPTIVIDALFERTGRTDVEAARLITKGCLDANGTVRPAEIARLIRTAEIPPRISNPVGLLIRALPSRCSPESLANYRNHWHQQDEQEKQRRAREDAQSLNTAKNILESLARGEEWDSASVEWAKGLTGNAE